MKKSEIHVHLGLLMLRDNCELTAAQVGERTGKFFKGCSTIAKMHDRIKLNGGWAATAELLAAEPIRFWKIQ